MAAYRPPPADS